MIMFEYPVPVRQVSVGHEDRYMVLFDLPYGAVKELVAYSFVPDINAYSEKIFCDRTYGRPKPCSGTREMVAYFGWFFLSIACISSN